MIKLYTYEIYIMFNMLKNEKNYYIYIYINILMFNNQQLYYIIYNINKNLICKYNAKYG